MKSLLDKTINDLQGTRSLLFVEHEVDDRRERMEQAIRAARGKPDKYADMIDRIVHESTVADRIRASVGKPLDVLNLSPNVEGDLRMLGITTVLELWLAPVLSLPDDIDFDEIVAALIDFDRQAGLITCH